MVTSSQEPIRVALVEDHAPTRAALERQLVQLATRLAIVVVAGDAETLIGALEKQTVDVVVMDLGLPGMGGCEAIRIIAQRWPGTRSIALTVFDDERNVLDAVRAGAHGYLLKDESAERVALAIDEAARGAHPVSSRIAGYLMARARRVPAPASLSEREGELASALAEGLTYAECAARMGLGIGTVQDYVKRLYRKLDVNSRSQVRDWVEEHVKPTT